jgi:hypothetical protein
MAKIKGRTGKSETYYLTLPPYTVNRMLPSRCRPRPTPIRTSNPERALRRLLGVRQFRILFGDYGLRFVVGSILYGVVKDATGCPIPLGAVTAKHPWRER